jgi:hypothetical protein
MRRGNEKPMTRNGKIARLPREVREQLNRRLFNGEPGNRLVEWLNGLPETQRVLADDFGGREINEQNLSEWKQGGFREWETRQETLAQARELDGGCKGNQRSGGRFLVGSFSNDARCAIRGIDFGLGWGSQ